MLGFEKGYFSFSLVLRIELIIIVIQYDRYYNYIMETQHSQVCVKFEFSI